MLKIKVIMGSVREGRFNDKASNWVSAIAKRREGIDVEILDLKEWNLPVLSERVSPSQVKDGKYSTEIISKWAQKIQEADAFIMVTPEYNHSTSGALKNSIDHIYGEWNNKAVGYVAYGSLGGGRAMEHLRGIAAEVQMADVRAGVNIMAPWTLVDEKNELKEGALDSYERAANLMIDQIISWGTALKAVRAK